jgi:TRAP-type mannitol/chloroaromatic compound transport system permease small subunit
MSAIIFLSRCIDQLNERVGKAVYWLLLIAVIVCTVNALVRYSLDMSSNAWLELQWYLFSGIFLPAAGYTLLRNEHIRIDVVSGRFGPRARAWIDIVGTIVFLLPVTVIVFWLSLPIAWDSFANTEMSSNAGGLLRWPVKIMIQIGFLLLSLQGVSELIKRAAFLGGMLPDPGERRGHA